MPDSFYEFLTRLVDGLKKAIEHEATLKALQSGKPAHCWREFASKETLELYDTDPREKAPIGVRRVWKSDIQFLYDHAKKSKAKLPADMIQRIKSHLEIES